MSILTTDRTLIVKKVIEKLQSLGFWADRLRMTDDAQTVPDDWKPPFCQLVVLDTEYPLLSTVESKMKFPVGICVYADLETVHWTISGRGEKRSILYVQDQIRELFLRKTLDGLVDFTWVDGHQQPEVIDAVTENGKDLVGFMVAVTLLTIKNERAG